jgi:cell division protein FtsB
MAEPERLVAIARQKRLQEWIQGLERRISVERRFKVLTALRRELEKCREDVKVLEERISRLDSEESESQAS